MIDRHCKHTNEYRVFWRGLTMGKEGWQRASNNTGGMVVYGDDPQGDIEGDRYQE